MSVSEKNHRLPFDFLDTLDEFIWRFFMVLRPTLSLPFGIRRDILEALDRGFGDMEKSLDRLEKKDIKIIIQLDTSIQQEILAVLKDIQEKLGTTDFMNMATKAEVDSILGPVLVRLRQVGTETLG